METRWTKWGIVEGVQVWQQSVAGPRGLEVFFCATPLNIVKPNEDSYPKKNSVTLALLEVPKGFLTGRAINAPDQVRRDAA